MSTKSIFRVLLAVLLFAGVSQAAVVTWSSVADIPDDGTLSIPATGGDYDFAWLMNDDSGVDTTVNGVTFYADESTNPTASSVTITFGVPANTGFGGAGDGPSYTPAEFATVMTTARGTWDGTSPMTLSFDNLTVGRTYTAQFLMADFGTTLPDHNFSITSGGVNSGSIVVRSPSAWGGSGGTTGGPGQKINAVWTADGTSQLFAITPDTGSDTALLNAVSIFSVPEPATLAVLAIGGLLSLFKRRRRA